IMMMYFNLQNPEDMLDLISGVFNYIAMREFLDIRISKSRQLWLVAVDVGGIRRINSSFGVSVGNEIFAEIGKYFNALDGGFWPFRMFGTRFLIIADSPEDYQRAIEEIEERFQSPWLFHENEISLSVTIRYFSEWDFFKSPEDVVNLIDVAFAEIGAEGWGIKKRISTELLIKEKRRLTVETTIREALKAGDGFSLRFQPIYSPVGQNFSHVEALLRLDCAEYGGVPPSEFIYVAEKTGLILQIDELVIKMACEFLIRNTHRLRGLLTQLNINLSAAEFYKNPSARIEGLIRELRIPPDLLCFEVTETAATSHPGTLAGFMSDMKIRGYHFALDDFGTGYANLSRVIELPFETVKLDRSLLLPQDERSGKLFANVLKMFSQIGISTVVEGVETAEQAERARLLG
ncbi:MAG: GGDEF domain-containing protein, partial [Clostridia bacterium]|nr:GGDEF domain-containing protein [Clostridia bacterium]